MSNVRKLHWWETEVDAAKIVANKWLFNIAQEVTTIDGQTISNVIWQSAGMAPVVDLEWDVDYALGWTAKVPSTGVRVNISGKWQPCQKGEVYDIDSNGYWTSSSEDPRAGWLSVGKVDYKYPNVDGIHILVGVKNQETGKYDPIFIDPTALPPGSNGQYQPQEKIKWWLGGGTSSGSVYSATRGAVATMDYSNPAPKTGKYEWWTTYVFEKGKWMNSPTAPPDSLLQATSVEVSFLPLIHTVIFGIEVEVGVGLLTTYIRTYLGQYYIEVTVNWLSPRELNIGLGPRTATADDEDPIELLLVTGSEKIDINNALLGALRKGDLPKGETWSIDGGRSVLAGELASEDEDDQDPVTPPPPATLPLAGAKKPKRITSSVLNGGIAA